MTTPTEGIKPEWDDPLPEHFRQKWKRWCESLTHLSNVRVPRAYSPHRMSDNVQRELHVFSDASMGAIAACCYIRLLTVDGHAPVRFLAGKSKLSMQPTTIPRLDLCAAVLAAELAELVTAELGVKLTSSVFYTDSQVVLGYI